MSNGEWKVGQAKFQGYMKAKVEDISADIKDMCEHNKLQDEKISKVEKSATENKIKLGLWGSISGIIGGFIAGFFGR